ncbi:MAG: C25 family cysteine peptidase [Nanoarchaeota archaeon]|nr:C25 family cysteine peptidase [Nanoarchaeota archaeon]
MTKKFLITRPNHDVMTSYLHDFSKETVVRAKASKNVRVAELEGEKAIRKNFESMLSKECPQLVFLNGHGDSNNVTGHRNEVILDAENVNLTEGKIVYALACDSLEELGEKAIKKGATAYIGYNSSFMIVRDPSRESSPSKDKNALPFKKACSVLINSLLFNSLSAGESIEKTKEEYRRQIKSYGTSEDDPYGDVPLIRFALAWNLEFLDMHGDANASF